MALLEITQSRQITATIRLDEKVAAQVDQYAAFIHGPADEVVNHALDYVFSKDRDFQEYLKSAEATAAAPILRIRRVPQLQISRRSLQGRGKPVHSHRSAGQSDWLWAVMSGPGTIATLRVGRIVDTPPLKGLTFASDCLQSLAY